MRRMTFWRFTLLAVTAAACQAQAPLVEYRGILNAASRMPAGLPGGSIARGSIFTVTGKNLGPTATPDLSDPLQTTLGGVGIVITQGATSVNAIPLTVAPGAISAIMPSNAPLGMASLRLSYKNVRSNPMPVQVVNSQVGLFTVAGAGNGPGMIQNDNGDGTTTTNTLQTPAQPGQTVYVSATGLGPIASDAALSPDPSNLTVKTEVFVGGIGAAVVSNGRSAPGVDSIGFVIPDVTPLGCWTPVYVRTAGTAISNFVTISVSADGSPCQEPNNVLSSALINGGNIGSYAAVRLNVRHDVSVNIPRDATTDLLGAYQAQEVAGPANFNPMFSLPPAGSCTVYTIAADLASDSGSILPGMTPPTGAGLDGGGVSLTGNKGTVVAQAGSLPGMSAVQLGGAIPSLPLSNKTFLDPGGITLTIPGGNDIGSTSVDSAAPAPFTWTNRDQIQAITRSRGLSLIWTGGDAAASIFIVAGGTDMPTNSTAIALCIVPPGSTSFTVPADVLANLPATRPQAIQSRGAVYIGQWNLAAPAAVSAAGLDFGAFLPVSVDGKTVSVQ